MAKSSKNRKAARAAYRRPKILTVVGTRPELIKLCLVLKELDESCEHILAHTGQNFDYELNEVFFKDLNIRRPDYFLNCARATPMETIGAVLVETDKILEKERPDALLIYGDTNSCLAVIAAKRRKVPVFHMEAGNRCFDQRVPEELNRKVIDHLSDINMTITEHARRYLVAEGLPAERVIKVGSSMKEIFEYFANEIAESKVVNELKLKPKEYFVVSSHREENVDNEETLARLMQLLKVLDQEYGLPIIFSVHPRTRKRLEALGDYKLPETVKLMKPFGFRDYIQLQKSAACVISDSGTLTEESALLGFPALMIREAHERPEGMDEGVLVMNSLKSEFLLHSIQTVIKNGAREPYPVADYQMSKVSKAVSKIILSYIDYINHNIWHK